VREIKRVSEVKSEAQTATQTRASSLHCMAMERAALHIQGGESSLAEITDLIIEVLESTALKPALFRCWATSDTYVDVE
jgi:hypothetical protein